MEIRTFGDSGRQRECERRLLAHGGDSLYERLILLPIPTSRDGVHITGTDIPLETLLSSVTESTLVAGYNIPEPFASELISRSVHVYDAGLDEGFLVENAEITAKGALGKILCTSVRDITELRIAIIGYGRIGSRLLRYLLFLGASVTVYTGRESNCISLSCDGVDARRLTDARELCDFDLIINTAPAPIIPDSVAEELSDGAKILDLASGAFTPKHPCVIKLASVPDTMYPVTAGGVYAKYIANYLFLERG